MNSELGGNKRNANGSSNKVCTSPLTLTVYSAHRATNSYTAAMAPKFGKDLRACLVCSILQRTNEFLQKGCPNCEEIMDVSVQKSETEYVYLSFTMY